MAHASRFTRCTAQRDDESFCDAETVPDAPFPICVRHLAQAAEFLNSVAPRAMRSVLRGPQVLTGQRPDIATVPNAPVVYYVRVEHLVKIGFTRDMRGRMRGYPPTAVLLATEPGEEVLEARRHQQFAQGLAHRREWFHPSVALIQHINGLREQPLTAAELAA